MRRSKQESRLSARARLPVLGGSYDPRADGTWEEVRELEREVATILAAEGRARARKRFRRSLRARSSGASLRTSRARGGATARRRCTSHTSEDEPGEEAQGPALRETVNRVLIDTLKEHPQAGLIPEMRPAEYAALVADVYRRGVLEPLLVAGDVILDGRHRLRAADEAGLQDVPTQQVDLQGEEPVAYMLRSAVLRRHLSDDQRAMVAASFAREHPRPLGRPPDRAMRDQGEPQSPDDRHPSRTEAARLFAASPGKVKKAIALLNSDAELAEEVRRGELRLSQALAIVRRREQLEAIERTPLPAGVYRTIVADPPWRYDDTNCNGAAEAQYPTMSVEAICALPIDKRAADDAHFYLWTTGPMLPEAFKVLAAWGFKYVTTLTWRKPHLGLGRYFRSVTEFVLFGVRGTLPLKAQDIPNLLEAPQGRHSEKPEEFFALVERASPAPYLELFARRVRSGPDWTCWGAEAEGEGNSGATSSTGIIGTTLAVKPQGADS